MRLAKTTTESFKLSRVNNLKIKKTKNLKSFQGFLVSLFCVIFPYHVKVTILLKKRIIGLFLKTKYELYDCFSLGQRMLWKLWPIVSWKMQSWMMRSAWAVRTSVRPSTPPPENCPRGSSWNWSAITMSHPPPTQSLSTHSKIC